MNTDSLPITAAQVRDWCRIDQHNDDDLILSLIVSASAYAASMTGLDLDTNCPEPVRHAIAIMVADSYANREGQLVGNKTVDRLLAPYRTSLL